MFSDAGYTTRETDGSQTASRLPPLRKELSELDPWVTSILRKQMRQQAPRGAPNVQGRQGQGTALPSRSGGAHDTVCSITSLKTIKPRPFYIQPMFARAWIEGWSDAKDDHELIESISTFLRASSALYGLNVADGELRVAQGYMSSRDLEKLQRARRSPSRVTSLPDAEAYAETAWRCLVKSDDALTDKMKSILAKAHVDYWQYHQEHVAKGCITLSGYLTARAWHAYLGGAMLGHLRELQCGLVIVGEATSWLQGSSMVGHCLEVVGDTLRQPRRLCTDDVEPEESPDSSVDGDMTEMEAGARDGDMSAGGSSSS